MRAVVTGGAGFLGSHLCERLLAEGWDVLAFDNLVTGVDSNVEHLIKQPKFRMARADVANYIDVAGPVEYVLHFASPASPVDYLKLPIPTLKVGALGTHNALGLALAKNAKFFLASTSECYGDPEISPQHEEYWGHVNPVGPRGVYDEAKRYAEAMTMAYHRYHKVDTRIVRIFNTYGPRMRRHRLHHKHADHPGDPNKLSGDGFWRTLYLCVMPYQCKENLAGDKILKSWTLRVVANPAFAILAQAFSFYLLWKLGGSLKFALVI